LVQQNKSAFVNENTLHGHVHWLIAQNRAILGTLGYSVYVQTPEGLTLVTRATGNSATFNIEPGQHTFVVKSEYSNFTANASSGVRVTVNVN